MINIKDIATIELCFENCTSAIIPYDSIESLYIDGITSSITKPGINNGLYMHDDCTSLEMDVLDTANINGEYKGYGDKQTVFNRLLQYNDITSILITDTYGNKENIYPVWSGEENNIYQHTKLIDNKVHIEIRAK